MTFIRPTAMQRPEPFSPPADAVGAGLLWWWHSARMRTLVTIPGRFWACQIDCAEVELTFAFFDTEGAFRASFVGTMRAAETLFLDSSDPARLAGRDLGELPGEGVLAIFVCAIGARPGAAESPLRFVALVDWYSDDGELVSLHNDASVVRGENVLGLTEIVIRETPAVSTSIVVVNGPALQDPGALVLEVRNAAGEVWQARYPPGMAPFSLHKIRLGELFPGLADLCAGEHATVSGSFACRRLFTRPYVITQGERLAGYHAGDFYPFRSIPGGLHHFLPPSPSLPPRWARLLGQGEMNPAAAIHLPGSLTTAVNLLNTHGFVEADFWVDVRLHDASGALVVERERWRCARRNQLARIELADLLPRPDRPFIGHFALRFSRDGRAEYPRRLQALMEYRSKDVASRVMLWSDRWNTPERLRAQGHAYKGLYRVWCRPPRRSFVLVSNCAVHAAYDRAAPYEIVLEDGHGRARSVEGVLPPHGTVLHAVDDLFADAGAWLGPEPAGVIVVSSPFDLASMHLTHDTTSGVFAAEHLMAVADQEDGIWYTAAGA